METSSLYEWKQAMEGLARGVVGPFEQSNECVRGVSYRDYYDKDVLVLRMITFDSGLASRVEGAVRQEYQIDVSIKKKVVFIYIPTQEEYDAWDWQENETNVPVLAAEIAKREKL